MKLSILIPAHNEADSIAAVIDDLLAVLEEKGLDHEILVIDDASTDGTAEVVAEVAARHPAVRCLPVAGNRHGFGLAVRTGLREFKGDAVAIVMADGSDDPEDVVLYHRLLEHGYDCVFGSRFIPGGTAAGYPRFKLVLNRVFNLGIRALFRHGYNDTTNAFKAYRRDVVENVEPLLSHHFNLTVELPLKAVVRGHSYAVVPIGWRSRRGGESKLRLQEMGSRYLFIVLYVFLEHHLSAGDYHREGPGHLPHRLGPGLYRLSAGRARGPAPPARTGRRLRRSRSGESAH